MRVANEPLGQPATSPMVICYSPGVGLCFRMARTAGKHVKDTLLVLLAPDAGLICI